MAKRTRAVVSVVDEPVLRRRPPSVTLVASLYVLQGGLVLVVSLAALVAVLLREDAGAAVPVTSDQVLQLVGGSIACIGLLTAAFGLLMLRRWGWVVAMTTECFVLTFDLASYLAGHPFYIGMVIGALTVLLLNQRHVRLAFESRSAGNA